MGAHQPGANAPLDVAVERAPKIEALFRQLPETSLDRSDGYRLMDEVLAMGAHP
jgi:flagellar biosynthesis/type III secretory pathway ATPase